MRDPEREPLSKKQRTETAEISEASIEILKQPVEDDVAFLELWSATFEIRRRIFKTYETPGHLFSAFPAFKLSIGKQMVSKLNIF